MTNGVAVLEPVEMRIDAGAQRRAVDSQKLADDTRAIFMFRDGGCDLDAVAGREHNGLCRAALLKHAQGLRNGFFGDGELLPELYRRSLMADSGDEELHCTRRLPRLACATHVMAEQKRAMMARMAAFRPRQ